MDTRIRIWVWTVVGVSVLAGLMADVGRADPTPIWTIGREEGGPTQFALFGHYPEYLHRFPADVHFVIGTSDPSRDWSFIQPGPDDVWAGSRSHTFTVEFDLAQVPQEACRLLLVLANTHWGNPPLLRIVVNGNRAYQYQLPPGADDRSLSDARVGRKVRVAIPLPASVFRAGANTLAITTASGSWMLYDYLRLETGITLPEEDLVDFQAESTPFFRKVRGRLRQAVRLTFNNMGTAARVEVQAAGMELQSFPVQPGANTLYVLVPPFERTAAYAVRVSSKPGVWHTVTVEGRPERRWRVYVVPSSHTDIGYTDLQERVFRRHNENTLKALNACDTDPAFVWNLEVAAQADFLKAANARAFAQLMERVHAGRIGLPGLYLNMLTGLCDGEELIAAFRRSHELGRTYGFQVQAANLTDVPSAVGTLPMVLAGSGIRYFAEGVNQDRGPVFAHADKRMHQSPFWWEWFDGSRVLAWLSDGYAQASALGLTDNVDTLGRRLIPWLRSFDRPEYPGDAVFVYGAFSDNQPMDPKYARVAEEWNSTWEYPKILVSTEPAFFRYVEAKVGRKLPVFRGDPGTYWEDGAGSSALETALARWARTRLELAQRWDSFTTLLNSASRYGKHPGIVHEHISESGSPGLEGDDAIWRDLLFYDEHTWGAWCSVSQPASEQTIKQWAFKSAFAYRAAEAASKREADALDRFVATIRPSRATGRVAKAAGSNIVVLNPQSWPQGCIAWLPDGNLGHPGHVEDVVSGKRYPVQSWQGKLFFVARNVPACGWRSFIVGRGGAPPSPPVLSAGQDPFTWKTPRFLLRLDPATGSIMSLRDLRTGREWVDGTSPYKLNQFLYVLGGGDDTGMVHPGLPQPKLDVRTHTHATVHVATNGPVLGVLQISRTGEGVPGVDTTLTFDALGHVIIRNVVHKPMTLAKEAGYFAFPFRLSRPSRAADWVDLPYGIVQVEKEQLPGACREWYTANSFAAVSDGIATAYLCTPHAPLLTVGDIFRGAWRAHIPASGTLFSYVFNNYWHTNYKAGQAGDLVFSYALHLEPKAFNPANGVHFGWSALQTMEDPRRSSADDPSILCVEARRIAVATPEGSLLRVTAPLAVGGMRPARGGLEVRLYNPEPHPVRAMLEVPGGHALSLQRLNLMGEPLSGKQPMPRGGIVVGLGPRSIASVRVSPGP